MRPTLGEESAAPSANADSFTGERRQSNAGVDPDERQMSNASISWPVDPSGRGRPVVLDDLLEQLRFECRLLQRDNARLHTEQERFIKVLPKGAHDPQAGGGISPDAPEGQERERRLSQQGQSSHCLNRSASAASNLSSIGEESSGRRKSLSTLATEMAQDLTHGLRKPTTSPQLTTLSRSASNRSLGQGRRNAARLSHSTSRSSLAGIIAGFESASHAEDRNVVHNQMRGMCTADSWAGSIMSVEECTADSWALQDVVMQDEWFQSRSRQINTMKRMWEFMTDPSSSLGAHVYQQAMNPIIILSILASMSQTIKPPMFEGSISVIFSIEVCFEILFAADIIARFVCCPARSRFFRNAYNDIDIAAALLLIVRILLFSLDPEAEEPLITEAFTVLVPVFRLLKLLRRFETFHLVLVAFREALEALPVLMYTLCVLAMSFSAIIFLVEPRWNIDSLPRALWLTIVTMMTVGYGDVTPETTSGHLVTVLLIISSILYMAIPLGIIGNAFNRIWSHRHELLMLNKTRARLQSWGYTGQEIPKLFHLFDLRQRGALSYSEFRRMILKMNIGFGECHIRELFESFDQDGSGTVDHQEFTKAVFPGTYYEMLERYAKSSLELQRGSSDASSKRFMVMKSSSAQVREEGEEGSQEPSPAEQVPAASCNERSQEPSSLEQSLTDSDELPPAQGPDSTRGDADSG